MVTNFSAADIPSVRTGFWDEVRLVDPDFDHLENIKAGNTVMMEYLHGFCTVWALVLHDLYGYPVYCLADPDEVEEYGSPALASAEFPIIHDFCVVGSLDDDDAKFLDCRGAVSNEKLFLEEFRDFFDAYDLLPYTEEQLDVVRTRYWNSVGFETADGFYNDAKGYILAHQDQFVFGVPREETI